MASMLAIIVASNVAIAGSVVWIEFAVSIVWTICGGRGVQEGSSEGNVGD